MLFDGASLVLYMCGVVVYITNIVKGLRVITLGAYGVAEMVEGENVVAAGGTKAAEEAAAGDFVGREDSLKVMAASNTILALVLVGVLVLQAGQWYAQKKEAAEIEEMDRVRDEKKKSHGQQSQQSKKRQ